MTTEKHRHDGEDFDGFEASLKSLRPRALPERFADAVATESLLASLTPAPLPEDFADAVAMESLLGSLAPRKLPAGFADRVTAETALRDVVPAPLPEGFTDRVDAEIALRSVSPRELPAGFVDRVVAASTSARPAGLIIAFRRTLVPLSAAAAVAIAATAYFRAAPQTPVVANVETLAPAAAEHPVVADTDGLSLPIVTLPDGSAYRPVIRNRYAQPVDFRATPFGIAVPVTAPASGSGVDYEPVMFE